MFSKSILSTLLLIVLSTSVITSAQAADPLTSTAQQKSEAPLIPISAFFNNSAISGIKLSPDGKWIAFTKKLDGISNIFLVEKGKKISESFALTQSKEPINSFQWGQSNNKIFFTKDKGGNENMQIYLVSFNSKKNTEQSIKETALTKNPNVRYYLLKQIKHMPDKLLVMANHDNAEQLDVFHLNIKTKKVNKIVDNKYGFNELGANNSGEIFLTASMNKDNSKTLYVKNKENWQPVLTTAVGDEISILEVDEINNLVYLAASIQGRDKKELLSFDLTNHTFKSVHRDPENQSDVHDVEFNSKGQPVAVSYYGGRLRTYPLTKTFSKHWNIINQHFTDEVEIDITSMHEKQQQWQLTVASDVTKKTSYSYNTETHKLQVLLPQKQKIKPEELSKRQSITYKARDGITIQAYLTLPNNKQKTNLPTVILPHGGPWARDYWTLDSNFFNKVTQLLANRGYAVLQPNFRASTGFGKKFINLGNKNWGTGSMQHDLTDGVNYLIDQGIADKKRVGIFGGSYGGYAALAGITFTPDLYKASVSFVGPSSLITLTESFPSYLRPYVGQFFNGAGDPLIEADRIDMNARSPINFVDNIKAPLMLLQGANDPRVTQIESDNIARAMFKKGLPVEYVLAKDEGHGFHKQKNKLAALIAIEKFLAKHLGGRMDVNTPKELKSHLDTLRVDIQKL